MYESGFVVITRVPNGDIPLWVRTAWVGLVLPFVSYVGYVDFGIDHGLLTSEEMSFNRRGYSVPQIQAINILERENERASKWWKDQGLPLSGMYFGFNEEEAEVVNEMQVLHRLHPDPDIYYDPEDIFLLH